MRELPEIEVLRRDLEREVVGRKIKSAEARSMALLGGYPNRKAFTSRLEGTKIRSVARRGLHLVLGLEADRLLVVFLGAHGGLRRVSGRVGSGQDAELTATFTQQGGLQVLDPAGTVQVALVEPIDRLADEVPAVDPGGFDPIDEPMSWTAFAGLLQRKPIALKTLLGDPGVVIGVGEVYADEILFNAGLRFDRVSDTLSVQEMRRLYRALVEVLHEAVKHRGTSIGEHPFSDLFGRPGDYQNHLAVYGREGELSPRSRTPIRKVRFEGRWTYYCDTQV